MLIWGEDKQPTHWLNKEVASYAHRILDSYEGIYGAFCSRYKVNFISLQ